MKFQVEARAILSALDNHRPSRDQVDSVERLLEMIVQHAHPRITRSRDRWRKRAEKLRDSLVPELVWDQED